MSRRTYPRAGASGSPREARVAMLRANEGTFLAAAAHHVAHGFPGPFVVVLADRRDAMGAKLTSPSPPSDGDPLALLVVDREGFGAVLDAFQSDAAPGFREARGVSFAAVVAHGGVTLQPLTLPAPAPRTVAPWGVN